MKRHFETFILGALFGAAIALLAVVLLLEQPPAAAEGLACNLPTAPALTVYAADIGAAKETCHRHHLSWTRLELSNDGSHLSIYCESEEIARQQILMRSRELGCGDHCGRVRP